MCCYAFYARAYRRGAASGFDTLRAPARYRGKKLLPARTLAPKAAGWSEFVPDEVSVSNSAQPIDFPSTAKNQDPDLNSGTRPKP